MSAELEALQLVNPATQALLTAMMIDGWSAVKKRFATLFASKKQGRKQAEAQLERSRTIILAEPNNDAVRAQIAIEWQETFRELLLNSPDIASPLRKLIDDVSQLAVDTNRNEIRNLKQQAKVRDEGTVFQQGTGNQFKIN